MPNGESKSALVIDDEEAILKLMTRSLEGDGYSVVATSSGENAEPLYRATTFDLVVCDYKLPGIDGIETIRRIKQCSPDIGSALITGFGSQETILEAFTTGGVDYYLNKPFGLAELNATAALAYKAGSVRKQERQFKEELSRQVEDATAELQEKTWLLLADKKAIEKLNARLVEKQEKLRNLNEQLQQLAITDALTNIANRRHFMERLSAEVTRVQRTGEPLSLLMIDLDDFKKINDGHGHLAGDAVLRRVADVIGSAGRAIDLAARYGGEEFALILPSVGVQGATVLAERIRSQVASLTIDVGHAVIGVTLCIGVARFSNDSMTSADDLLRASDTSLYQAKENGKNRVTVHQGSE